MLSASYNQGLVHTFGRANIDEPLAQSTLRNALDAAQFFINPSAPQVDHKKGSAESSQDISDDKTEIWNGTLCSTDTGNMGKIFEKTEMWEPGMSSDSTLQLDDTDSDDWIKESSSKNMRDMQILQNKAQSQAINKQTNEFTPKGL